MSTFGEAIVKVNMKYEGEISKTNVVRHCHSRGLSFDGDSFQSLSVVNGMVEDTMSDDDLSSHDNDYGLPVSATLPWPLTDCVQIKDFP